MKKVITLFLVFSVLLSSFLGIAPSNIKVAQAADDYSTCIDFEQALVPTEWSVVNNLGSLAISQNHFKHGTNSLLWNWTSGSKIRAVNPLNLAQAATNAQGGMKAWIYNETPINASITFKFGTQQQLNSNNPHYKFEYNLNFKGWRALWIKFNQEGANPSYTGGASDPLEAMEVSAPNQAGSVYFDIIEFVNAMPKSRSADYQMPKTGVADMQNMLYWDMAYYYSQLTPSLPAETTITQAQINDFNKISAAYEQWIYGQSLDLTKEPLSIRNTSLQAFISEGVAAYPNLHIVKYPDGRIVGDPLFSSRDPHLKKFGEDVSRNVLLALAYDYKINGNVASKEKFFNVLDYMNDQGWAYGSGLGTMDHESNKHCGYFHAIYLMKEELRQTGRLERERNTIYWYSIFAKTFETTFSDVTADELRTKFMYNLLYVLLMDNTPEKVRYMKGLVNYYNQSLQIAPGYAGTIKNDFSLYHHRGTYLGAYGSEGIHMASLIAYLVSNTTFSLSQQSMDNLKNALLNTRIYSNMYNVPVGTCGRLPDLGGTVNDLLPAFAYMAYAKTPVDTEMASAFMRLWQPNSTYLKDSLFPKADSYAVQYLNTMGGLQLAVNLAEAGYQAETSPSGTWIYPYSALAINRRNNWMVSVKGYSQYVWDYEAANKFDEETLENLSQNVFGRYQSYGSMQINGTGSPIGTVESGYDLKNGWDWNRWPASTTKHLTLDELRFTGESSKHRLFSDKTFVGGVTSQNQYGMFGMMLHDLHFDSTFKANKSVFFFGDKIICLGSDIQNTDTLHNTETTLFQSAMPTNTMPFWYNNAQAITTPTYTAQVTNTSSAWLIDPYNNGYYLPNANGLKINRGVQNSKDDMDAVNTSGNYSTAWIDHGTNPSGKGYEYAIKVGTTPQNMTAFVANPGYTVLQKDQNAHIVKNTDPGLSLTGYAVMNQSSAIAHGYLQNVSKPCMVMTKDVSADEIVLSMSDPDLRLPKFTRHKDITDAAVTAQSVMEKTTLTLRGTWALKAPSSEARVISAGQNTTTIEFDCVNGKTIEVGLVKSAPVVTAVTLNATDDGYVRDGSYASTSYGTGNLVIRKANSAGFSRESYAKFDLSSYAGTSVSRAELKLYTTKVDGLTPISIYAINDDTWTESTLNWNNAPAAGSLLTTVNVNTLSQWYTFDVTAFVNAELSGNKKASFLIKDASGTNYYINFANREVTNGPQLYLAP